jgi:hypothetical protein
MRYQIVAINEESTSFILYLFDDLELARKKFDFTVKVASSRGDILMKSPSWKSIELQRVESICFSDIDNDT